MQFIIHFETILIPLPTYSLFPILPVIDRHPVKEELGLPLSLPSSLLFSPGLHAQHILFPTPGVYLPACLHAFFPAIHLPYLHYACCQLSEMGWMGAETRNPPSPPEGGLCLGGEKEEEGWEEGRRTFPSPSLPNQERRGRRIPFPTTSLPEGRKKEERAEGRRKEEEEEEPMTMIREEEWENSHYSLF